ncbi:MAG TPA: DNA repair protein RadA [Candidatus Anaerostipes excrementavium]|uniref:DNA repair protein RadA n=1 Tax=Candidatus Anaerostipes excrementavium TaxID=2838463 RepID=A0A9D1WWN2_9FIRM|nr:DNA repair protein RadA [uncultured Anaerostipes sp.]HIX68523.1 DNA repair protein RadA [Candidatus Anaerostipes excrementavium]
MARSKTVYFCSACGHESSKWMGQCPACKQWNTFVEEKVAPTSRKGGAKPGRTSASPMNISEVTVQEEKRISTGIHELDRVLGGGIVKGSLSLVGGDPGIGKSTLLLQVCRNMANAGKKVLYVSGEESMHQIKLRAERIGTFEREMLLFCETSLNEISNAILKSSPEFVVIDSIQTMYNEEMTSAAGSVSQVREVTGQMMRLAKEHNIAVFIVGHVTKEGVVAGPRTLEHMVDTVLYFEGEREAAYRILRGVKNRFGSTNEIGVFEMCGNGLMEVENPSKTMLNGRPVDASGSVVVCSMEGTRPILIEIQALISPTSFQMPRRTAVGIDYNRVNLLMAVLEKRVGFQLGGCDAYVNLAGGMRLGEPAIDLGVVMAIASSYKNVAVPEDTIIFGEVGLVGEVRAVSGGEARIKEAQKLGFRRCILPKANMETLKTLPKMQLMGVTNIREALDYL